MASSRPAAPARSAASARSTQPKSSGSAPGIGALLVSQAEKANKVNELWDKWMSALSKSYVKTLEMLSEGKGADAAKEYKGAFYPTVKTVCHETRLARPSRFDRFTNWTQWTGQLSTYTDNANFLIDNGKTELALRQLDVIRKHFDALHFEAQTIRTNDCIYAFHAELKKDQPSVVALRAVLASLKKAEPSNKASQSADAYKQAQDEWSKGAEAALKDGSLSAGELAALREATERFYLEFGIQFE